MAQGKTHRFYVSRNSWAAQAEARVRQALEELPMDRFIVMNDVHIRYGNIDHLVIRDDGAVFIIETKSHRGMISFDGKQLLLNSKPFRNNPICQINRNIRWLKKFIGLDRRWLWLTAILVFPNTSINTCRTPKSISLVTTLPALMKILYSSDGVLQES